MKNIEDTRLSYCRAKLQPQYWQRICSGEKTIEIRDQYTATKLFVFTTPDGDILGASTFDHVKTIPIGTRLTPYLKPACTTIKALERIYPHAIKNGTTTRPLYAYHITSAWQPAPKDTK